MDIFKGIGDFFGGLFGQKKKREDEQQPQQQQSAVSFNSAPKLGDNFANNLSNPTQPQQPKEFAKSSVDLNPVKPVQPVQPQMNRDQERQQLANKYRQEETDRYNQGSDHAANFLNDIFSGGKTAQMRENTINQNIQNRVNAEMLRKYGPDDQQVKQNIAQTSQNINKNATAVSDFTKNYNNNLQQTVSAPVSAVKGAANSMVETVPKVSGAITELGANTIKLFDENNQFANNLIKRVRADREKNIVRKTLNDATGLTDQDNKMAYGLGSSGARMAIDASMTPVTGGLVPVVVHGVEAHSEMMDHLDNIEARKKAEAAAKGEAYTPSSFTSRYLASTANAGAQAAIEKLGIDNLTGKIGGKFAKNMVGRAITGALGEAGEEGAQQYAENFTKKLFDNKQDIHEGVAESALMGGIMGGAGKMAFGGMESVKNPYKSNNIADGEVSISKLHLDAVLGNTKRNTYYDPKALYEAERNATIPTREKITLAEAERQNRGGDLQYIPRRETSISRLDSDQLGFTKDELIGRFTGDTRKRMSERSFNMLQDLRANNPYVTGDGQEISLTNKGNTKLTRTGQNISDDLFIAKMRTTPRINQIIENSTYSHSADDFKNHNNATGGFDYRNTPIRVSGKRYDLGLDIAKNNSTGINTLYNLNIKEPALGGFLRPPIKASSNTDSIAQNPQNVNDNTLNNAQNINSLYGATTKENISTPGLRDNPSTKSYADVYGDSLAQNDRNINGSALNDSKLKEEPELSGFYTRSNSGSYGSNIAQNDQKVNAFNREYEPEIQDLQSAYQKYGDDFEFNLTPEQQAAYERLLRESPRDSEGRYVDPVTGEMTIDQIVQDSKGDLVEIDQNIFEGVPRNERAKTLRKYLQQNLQGNEYGLNYDRDGNVRITKDSTHKIANPQQNAFTLGKKGEMISELPDILTISQKTGWAPDGKDHSFARDGFEYRQSRVKLGDEVYTVNLNVGLNQNGKVLYEINGIKKESPITGANSSFESSDSFNTNSIARNDQKVNRMQPFEPVEHTPLANGDRDFGGSFGNGFNPRGENSAVNKAALPEVETDQKTRKFAETVLDTDTPPKDFVKLMHAGDESLKYTPKKNSELWNRATKSVQESPERVFNELENTRVANDETMAKGIALAKHYQALGDDLKASELYVELAKKATEAGRTVQALNLMRRTTPEGVLMSTMREVESYNDKMKDKPNKQINITPEQRAEFLGKLREAYAMPEGDLKEIRARRIAIGEAIREVRDQIPSSKWDKFTTLWKAGLLTAPTTHIRNIAGNVINGGSEKVAQTIGSAFDWMIGKGTGRRTLTLNGFGGMLKGIKEGSGYAKDIMRTGIDTTGEIDSKWRDQRTNYGNSLGGKLAQGYTDFVFDSLNASDKIFRGSAEKMSIANQAKAIAINEKLRGAERKARIEQLINNPTNAMLENAKHDADMATFQQDTGLGQFVAKGRQAGGITKKATDIIMPFTGVPSAVADQLVNYSPLGVAKGVKQVADLRKAVKNGLDDSTITALQRKASTQLGRGITGTMLLGAGLALANAGLLVKIQGAFVAQEVVQNDGMWFARVKRDGIDVWMEP